MNQRVLTRALLVLGILGAGISSAFAGDSVYGKVTGFDPSGELVTFDYGGGQYVIRLAGITVPPGFADDARKFEQDLFSSSKNARMRLVRRAGKEMVSQLMTDDRVKGIKDVSVELLKNGRARRTPASDESYGYKYGDLKKAEEQAQANFLGIWAIP